MQAEQASLVVNHYRALITLQINCVKFDVGSVFELDDAIAIELINRGFIELIQHAEPVAFDAKVHQLLGFADANQGNADAESVNADADAEIATVIADPESVNADAKAEKAKPDLSKK